MIERWMPGTFTAPLSNEFVTDGPKLREFVRRFGKTDDGKPLVLDEWQAWLIDHVLERYPADWPVEKLRGRLRYKQAVISMGRQNGKSVLGAVFGMYGLMMSGPGATVIGLASNADQANIIYKRVKLMIDSNPALSRHVKTTATRGITKVDNTGVYMVKAAKGAALQGIPVTMCLYDEVHITPPEMWSAVVLGTTAQPDGMVVGITTAGDDNSELLKDLYEQGHKAASGNGDERFGFFLWEAPKSAAVDDVDALIAANPSLATDRIDAGVVLQQVRTLPENEARRYRLNQFVGSVSGWMPAPVWAKVLTSQPIPDGRWIYAIEKTKNWEAATVMASIKKDGRVYVEHAETLINPTLESLTAWCEKRRDRASTFVMDRATLGDLARQLDLRGIPHQAFSGSDLHKATSTAYALIAGQRASINAHKTLNEQIPLAVAKTTNGNTVVSRKDSSVFLDAVYATVFALYQAETWEEPALQIF